MFYIGNNEYDQVTICVIYSSKYQQIDKLFPVFQMLTGSWAPQWSQLNCMPLGLTVENLYDQLLKRPEFSEEAKLTKQDQAIVSQLKSQLGSALFVDEI